MAAKVQESENKRASKARIREGERGQWWPCETTDVELRELQNEGMISAHWSFIRDTDIPKPGAGEVVMTKAWVERGLSLPCSEFFLSILNTYGLQPHNICPNSYLLLSNFATLCEGHLGIRPDVKLWQFFFRVKKETKDKAINPSNEIFSELDEINAQVPIFPRSFRPTEGGLWAPDDMVALPVARATLWEKPRYEKVPSRRHREADPGTESAPHPPAGKCPEGFSIDTAAISTAIFITVLLP
ncbi:hypothetical protein QYE76_067124 [Lolium multiflorum]|uniref:Transposase (putative) gypsy type domain-containing protein n=1 Tax=Lolium multiflorum TaxID=4521 RepID=A0AAD8SC83_LOLMU|nr:hypothetical protein QYE76_067124 [Lolium multiflorum]